MKLIYLFDCEKKVFSYIDYGTNFIRFSVFLNFYFKFFRYKTVKEFKSIYMLEHLSVVISYTSAQYKLNELSGWGLSMKTDYFDC